MRNGLIFTATVCVLTDLGFVPLLLLSSAPVPQSEWSFPIMVGVTGFLSLVALAGMGMVHLVNSRWPERPKNARNVK